MKELTLNQIAYLKFKDDLDGPLDFEKDLISAYKLVEIVTKYQYVKFKHSVSFFHGHHITIYAPDESQQPFPMFDTWKWCPDINELPATITRACLHFIGEDVEDPYKDCVPKGLG